LKYVQRVAIYIYWEFNSSGIIYTVPYQCLESFTLCYVCVLTVQQQAATSIYNFIVQQLAATSELFTSVAATYVTQQFHIFLVSGIVLSKYKMVKKMFLNRQRAIRTTQTPSVSREDIASSTSRNIPASETAEQLPFRILDETFKPFSKFNKTGRSLLIKLNSLGEEQDPTTYLKECFTALTNYLIDKVPDRDLVGLRIRNTENVQDKVVGISLRRRDQLKGDVVWSVLGKVIQSNAT